MAPAPALDLTTLFEMIFQMTWKRDDLEMGEGGGGGSRPGAGGS